MNTGLWQDRVVALLCGSIPSGSVSCAGIHRSCVPLPGGTVGSEQTLQSSAANRRAPIAPPIAPQAVPIAAAALATIDEEGWETQPPTATLINMMKAAARACSWICVKCTLMPAFDGLTTGAVPCYMTPYVRASAEELIDVIPDFIRLLVDHPMTSVRDPGKFCIWNRFGQP